jgi:cell division protein FtsW
MFAKYNPFALWWKDIHKPTIYSISFLIISGLVAIFSASYHIGGVLEISEMHFFKKHIVFLVASIAIFFIISFQNSESIYKISELGIMCSLVALIGVLFISGKSVKGAERWLDLRVITIQPSEILKPFFIIISARIYYKFEQERTMFFPIMHGILYGFIVLLLFFQPDFGMILTYTFITLVLILISSIKLRTIFYLSIPVIALMILAFFSMSHVQKRIVHFLRGEKMYQTALAYNAIKNGGFLGKGIGAGEVAKKIPDSHNDFIFSRIGEELGGLFLITIIIAFGLLFFSNIAYVLREQEFYQNLIFNSDAKVAKYQKEILINNYIIILTIALLFFEMSVNMAVNLSLIPPKGMALPFISYGGSSMLANAFLIGFLCVANRRKYRFIPIT